MSYNLVKLPIADTISLAWKYVHGFKASVWAAIGIMILIMLGCIAFGALFNMLMPGMHLDQIIASLGQVVVYFMSLGLMYLSLQRAYDRPVTYSMVYYTFSWNFIWRFVCFYLLVVLILVPVFIAAVLVPVLGAALTQSASTLSPQAIASIMYLCFGILGFIGFYLCIRVLLGIYFLLDTSMGPWAAVSAAFRATRGNFWRLTGLLIVAMALYMLSIIPLGIGLIWSIPLLNLVYAVAYLTLKPNAAE